MSIISDMDKFQKYRDAIQEALAELPDLVARKKSLEEDISNLVQLVGANIAMLPASERKGIADKLESLKEPSGLSEAVTRTLSFTDYMSAAEVRDALLKSGYDMQGQANPLASIHTTLRRLTDSGRIVKREDGERTLYKRSSKVNPPPGVKPK